jgi:hypothetical protein
VDELIEGLNENGYNTLGYADDIVILVSGKLTYTVSEFLQEALSMVQQWCERTQLSINPQKMVVVPFSRKRDLRGLKEPTPNGYKSQIPWTHFGQGIDMEDTARKCDKQGL